jgi:hypothetical protein
VIRDADLWTVLDGSFRTALDHGQTTGRATAQSEPGWACWMWQELGPERLAVAVGEGETAEAAASLAEERLADEVARQNGRPPPGEC